jgi:hypothetical protein
MNLFFHGLVVRSKANIYIASTRSQSDGDGSKVVRALRCSGFKSSKQSEKSLKNFRPLNYPQTIFVNCFRLSPLDPLLVSLDMFARQVYSAAQRRCFSASVRQVRPILAIIHLHLLECS